jgi:spore coat protein U-like protein
MKKTTQFALIVALFTCFHTMNAALAASSSANLNVSVIVDDMCTISTIPVSFPDYMPLTTNSGTPDDNSAGSVTITCTTGTSAAIGLDAGNYNLAGQRRMSNGITSFINYDLYQDATHLTAWLNASPNWLVVSAAPSMAPRTYPVYARIPPGQSPASGSHSDTVVATVNF